MVVLDASVVLKWLLAEAGSETALRLKDRHLSGEEHIIVPSLLFYEVGNVLRYENNLPDEEIVELFDILNDLELTAIHPAFPEFEDTILYARHKDVSVYDATYVALARRLDCQLITADKRLARSVSESFVQLLEPIL